MTKTLIKIILELIKFYKLLYKSDAILLYFSVIFNCYKFSWALKKENNMNFIIKIGVSNIKFKLITCVIYIYKYIDYNIDNCIFDLDTIL